MATWKELAADNLSAAKELRASSHFRSVVSRAYYAAYSALTAGLDAKYRSQFKHGDNNPTHAQLLKLVARNLMPKVLTTSECRTIKTYLYQLWAMRVRADYDPNASIGRDEAINAITLAASVLRSMKTP